VAVAPRGPRRGHRVAADHHGKARSRNGAVVGPGCRIPAREPLVLREPAQGEVQVTVVADGRSVAHRLINLAEWLGPGAAPLDAASFWRGARWRSATTDSEGNARFGGVRAGEALVCVGEGAAAQP